MKWIEYHSNTWWIHKEVPIWKKKTYFVELQMYKNNEEKDLFNKRNNLILYKEAQQMLSGIHSISIDGR